MKTAKPPASASETLPGRRSQPLRQTRTNPPRSSAIIPSSGRTGGRDGRESVSGAAGHEQPIEIFPAVTHFADAITALPKELVRHFTLLKEVDAKIYVPQQSLFRLIDTALRMPAPNSTRCPYDGSDINPESAAAAAAAAAIAASTPTGGGRLPPLPPVPTAATSSTTDQSVYDASNLPRRQLFRQVASEIRDMLVALEEKKHVISTANDALNKQLARIDDIWPHLEQEFSDEAKWGSTTHWAYPENRAGLASNNAQAERSRREGAASLSAAAQQIADEAAARSDARKQAVAARRNQRAAAAHQESDADDLQQTKKSGGGSKSRKTLPDSGAGVGLGISAVGANGASSKRKKAEKPAAPGAPMERALSGVFGAAAGTGSKARTSSPRGSPAPDAKKRKALPAGGSQTKKSRNGTSAASSPVIGALPDVKAGRNLPTPFPPYAPEDIDRSASNGGTPGRGFGVDSNSGTGSNTQPDEMLIDAPANEKSTFSRAVPESTKQPFSSSGNNAGLGDDKTMHSGIGAGRSGANVSGIGGMGYGSSGSSSRGGGIPANGHSTAMAMPSTSGTQEISAGRDISGSRDASGREGVTASALLPSLRDNGPRLSSAVQMVALDPSRQRRPSPLSLAATPDGRQPSSSPLVSSATLGVDAASYVNGLRVSAGKPTKDGLPTATAAATTTATPTATTPTPTTASAPTPASAPAPEAALLPPPVPVSQTTPAAGPVAAPSNGTSEAMKIEPSENGSAMDSVSMTRTRSAGLLESKKQRDTKDGASNSGTGPATDKALSSDDTVAKKEPTPTMQAPLATLSAAQAPTVTTKSGRASRPSTPAHSTFAEAPLPGATPSSSRPGRASEAVAPSAGGSNGGNNGRPASSSGGRKNHGGSGSSSGGSSNGSGSGNGHGGAATSTNTSSAAAGAAATSTAFKRSHKKGASSVSAHQTQHGHGQAHSAHGRSQSASHNNSHHRGGAGDSETGGSSWQGAKSKQAQQQQEQGQSQEEDDDDPLYCYCNRVSFGEMIACDADDCKREWFHLECVGLRVAPKTSVKWYCDDCKKRLRANERKR